jgi:hypothetical protein
VSAWIRTEVNDPIRRGIVVRDGAYGLFLRHGRLVVRDFGSGEDRETDVQIADARWHHVAMSFRSGVPDGTTVHVDGRLVLTTTLTVPDVPGPLLVAAGGASGAALAADVDEVAVHPVALASARIAAHHRSGAVAAGAPIGLVAVPGDGMVLLNWTPSATPVDAHRVEYRPAGSASWTSAPATTADRTSTSVEGLPNDTTWEVRVGGVSGDRVAWSAAATARTAGYRSAVLADGPVGYWRLGEADGTVLRTEVGQGLDATAERVTLGRPGAVEADTAAAFSGTSRATITNRPELQLTTGTVEAWVRTTDWDLGVRWVVAKNRAYGIGLQAGRLVVRDWGTDNGAVRRTRIVADGRWHHLAVTFRSGVVDGTVVYLDGVPVLTTTTTFTAQNWPVVIGALNENGTGGLRSEIDEVAVYPTVLPPHRIVAHHRSGASGPDLTPPTAPTDLTATVDGTSVTLSWSPAEDDRGIASYIVRRGGSLVGEVPGNVTSLTEVLPPGTHTYELVAVDHSGNRGPASIPLAVDVQVPVTPPDPPTGLDATPGRTPDAVVLRWDTAPAGSGVVAYRVLRDGVLVATTTVPAHTDTGVPSGARHYTVQARNEAGRLSAPSPAIIVIIDGPDTTPPTEPTGLGSSVAGDTVTLTWTAATDDRGVNSYLVYRNGAYVGWSPTTTWTETARPPGTWNYDLRAVDAAGNRSAKSAPLAVTVG